jgi:hypothetical protein
MDARPARDVLACSRAASGRESPAVLRSSSAENEKRRRLPMAAMAVTPATREIALLRALAREMPPAGAEPMTREERAGTVRAKPAPRTQAGKKKVAQ